MWPFRNRKLLDETKIVMGNGILMEIEIKHDLASDFCPTFTIMGQSAKSESTNCHIINNQLFLKATYKILNAKANSLL
jgi:hypothetical protein